MATISEANAIHELLRYTLAGGDVDAEVSAKACEAAAFLAGRAQKALLTGIGADETRRRWPSPNGARP